MPASRTQKTRVKPKRAPAKAGKKASRESKGNIIAHDIAGIFLIVFALVLLLSLTMPSLGVVSSAFAWFLELAFGVGALLIPLSIAVLGISFFVPQKGVVSLRSALGLGLLATCVLAMISLYGASAFTGSNTFFFLTGSIWANAHGGIWGGAVAWIFLTLFGEPIGMVVLLGLLVTSLVLCGFSVSSFINRLHEQHKARKEEEVEAGIEAPLSGEHIRWFGRPAEQTNRFKRSAKLKSPGAPAKSKQKTQYLGERKTSVLDIENAQTAHLHPIEEILPEPKKHPPLEEIDEAQTEQEAVVEAVPQKTRKLPKKSRASKSVEQAEKTLSATKSKDLRPGSTSDALELPSMSLLSSNPSSASSNSSESELKATAERLQATLYEFGLKSKVRGWVSGPLVTTFKIEMGEGERVSKITNLEDDISLALASSSVRIFAPIPGTSLVGIEIPNKKRNNVCLGDVLPEAGAGSLEIAVGRDSEGAPVVIDLARLPHLLVAGTTGSGKSVMLNSAIMSILMRATPEQVRLILVDPKRVEFTGYSGLPHLYVPVVNEPQQAASSLQWAAAEMMRRLKLFEKAGARDIGSYNKLVEAGKLHDESGEVPDKVPYFVIVIDELADLMMVAGKEVEGSIVRIAQLGRAAGIHLIVATQRPSADVVTGLIKANIDNRVALSVDNGMNSRIIIDQNGAEKLLGNGDMLVKLRGQKPRRVQGCYVSDPEISSAVSFINAQGEPEYHDEILSLAAPQQLSHRGIAQALDGTASADDPLLWEAAAIIVESQLGSTSGLQRRLKVGYARAGRIMDMLQEKGIVGPPDGSKPREVLVTPEQLEELKVQDATYQDVE